MLKPGDKVALVCCSNAQKPEYAAQNAQLVQLLEGLGLGVVCSPFLYSEGPRLAPAGRAAALLDFYRDDAIEAIFDVSGGDVANEVLDFLDYSLIAAHPKPLFGYSDLTAVLNAVWAKTGAPAYLYQIKNLVYGQGGEQLGRFAQSLLGDGPALFEFPHCRVQGGGMEGEAVGGNTRCLLKLAGTPYWPRLAGKVLFLEGYGGTPARLAAQLAQLRQMGVFNEIAGLVLGTFTELEEKAGPKAVCALARELVQNPALPIVKTQDIGHGPNSRCLALGKTLRLG